MRGPTEVNIEFKGGGMMDLEIRLLDTALLAPAGYKDLASLGQFVGLEKRDVGENRKTMDIFINENPTKFYNYAMIDSVITLSYWLSIHNFTQSLGGGEEIFINSWRDICYRCFESFLKREGLSIRKLFCICSSSSNFKRYSSFARNSFMGGRGESFVVRLIEKQFHDLDLNLDLTEA